MNTGFGHNLKIVSAVHVAVLLVLIACSAFAWAFVRPRRAAVIPVEFVVEAPAPSSAQPDLGEIPAPRPNDKPEENKAVVPVPVKEAPPRRAETALQPARTERHEVAVSTHKVRRPAPGIPGGKSTRVFTEKEIAEVRRLMEIGAAPSDHTSISDDPDLRGKEVVRRTLHDAWDQPSKEEAGDAVAEAAIGLELDGTISSRRLVKPSGNETFDASVMAAVESVPKIRGLLPEFVMRHRIIVVSFKVE